MHYRKFGKLDVEVSALGFGCMRLPTIDNDPANIDEEKAVEMIRHGIDGGINYVDTAWPYHSEKGEEMVGKALQDGYRDKVFLATKSPVYHVKEPRDFDKYLDAQLQKLQTDHIDFYLLHALTGQRWQDCKKHQVFDFIKRAQTSGKIKYIGFSFHDELPHFKEIVDGYDWDFCQIQYNYMNEDYQAGLEGLKYAAAKGLPVIIMEPLLGGRLARAGTQLQKIWDEAPGKRSPVAWALRWLWNQPEVTLVLSGMSEMAHVDENLRTAQDAVPNSLSQEELAVVEQAKQYYLDQTQVDCTGCNYCADCPAEIKIPRLFTLYNDAHMFDEHEQTKTRYQRIGKKGSDFTACIDCGQCEEACPQHLKIRTHLRKFHKLYS